MEWLRLIKDHIVTSVQIDRDDLEHTPFAEKGGLMRFWRLFGDGMDELINDIDVNAGKNHFFYPLLHKNRSISLDDASEPVLKINDHFWNTAKRWIPEGWMTDQDFERTKKHFTSMQANLETFKSEIWNKLIIA